MANPGILERFRKSRTSWNQKEFAKKLSLTASTYGRIIRDERPLDVDVMNRVSELFNIPLNEILLQYQMDEGAPLVEEPSITFPSVQVIVTLDGNPITLNKWLTTLQRLNSSLVPG